MRSKVEGRRSKIRARKTTSSPPTSRTLRTNDLRPSTFDRRDGPMIETQTETTLRVAEALARDADRGIVRIDPEELAALGARTGDLLLVSGGRTTVAKALPTFVPDRGRGFVQLDGVARGNARLALRARVTLRPVAARPASPAVLPAAPGRSARPPPDAR